MDAVWFTVSFLAIAAIATKIIAKRRATTSAPRSTIPAPPVVEGRSLVRFVHTLFTKGLRATIHDEHARMGSVFTVSFLGLMKTTFLVGPDVLNHFYNGPESDINHGNMLDFMVPMFGKEVGYGVDFATRYEQIRFYSDPLKRPSKLRIHVDPIVQEVEGYFAKWGEEGTVDLKHEFSQLLMLISSRCLLGKEVREKMFDEMHALFHELKSGMRLSSVLFPYAPTPTNRRRDRARAKLLKIFSEVVRSRRRRGEEEKEKEEDVLQSLIDSRYKDGRATTEEEVTGMIILLVFGGMDTSTLASTWTGARLLSTPAAMAAAVEEQRRILTDHGHGDRVGYSEFMQMTTLHWSIKEALRMHPPSAVFFRKARRSFGVRTRDGREYEVPGGHTVASPVLFNSHLPSVYRDPDVYDPTRFGPGREEDRAGGKFTYEAFSCGRHSCVGEAYAYLQIKVMLSHLLRNFQLELVSPFPQTDWGKLVPEPKGKVMVRYKRQRLLSVPS